MLTSESLAGNWKEQIKRLYPVQKIILDRTSTQLTYLHRNANNSLFPNVSREPKITRLSLKYSAATLTGLRHLLLRRVRDEDARSSPDGTIRKERVVFHSFEKRGSLRDSVPLRLKRFPRLRKVSELTTAAVRTQRSSSPLPVFCAAAATTAVLSNKMETSRK
ncbi:hypothetical protein Trydic_g20249 [Trypoxylus dichotomus]